MSKQTSAGRVPKRVRVPLDDETADGLACGDMVSISGVIYTGRDAAHKRISEALAQGLPSPVDWSGQVIYYAGPTPARPGHVIGSCGPTTSGRMDAYTPMMLDQGLKAMIGKGPRSREVIESMRRHHAVYLAAIGGAAALIATCVRSCEVVAYEDLGPEAIRRMEVVDYPAIVVVDARGNDLFESGPAAWRR
ncbi:MAG: Fe-S-containing hydro-lyase [Atopobiaceae bacterium]